MAIENPVIAASCVERGKVRATAVPVVYELPVTNPTYVTSSSTSVYSERIITNYAVGSENFDASIWKIPVADNLSYFTYSLNSVLSPILTLTADRLKSNTLYGPVYLRQYFQNKFGVFTFSIYLKAPAGASLKLAMRSIDLFTGPILISETSVTISNVWQRFSLTGANEFEDGFMVEIGGDGTWAVNTEIDLWGAQLEEGPTMNEYVSTGNAVFTSSPASVSQTFVGWEEVSTAPTREGQIVSYRSGDFSRLYVAVDIDGTITWKPCIGVAEYVDPRTGQTPDPNLAFYSSLST